MSTHFQILGLQPVATCSEVHDAYRRKAALYHPDIVNGNQEMFVKINQAYLALKTETEKGKYLKLLKMTMAECTVCNGQGVVWKQRGFTARAALICAACDGAGYE